jgi:YVTN family beta-propeller protein
MKNLNKILLIFFTSLSLLLVGCNKENEILTPPSGNSGSGYLVINEGLYGQNNSTITFYDLQTGIASQNVYASANNGNNLGDTANDFASCCGKGFIVVDKSKKIEIISPNDFSSLGIIDFTSYGSPRHIIIPDSLHAYVTTTNDIVVEFNPTTNQITRTYPVGSKPEGITLNGNKLFVANSGFGSGNTVTVIDTSTHASIDEIGVWQNPLTLISKGDIVYLISIGKYDREGLGALTVINPLTLTPTDTLAIPKNPGKAIIAGNNLYVINGDGLLKINTSDSPLSYSIFIPGNKVNPISGVIYSVTYDLQNDMLLLGNCKDFMQNGDVKIFDMNGNKIKEFDCGLNPGTISLIIKN